MAFVEELRVRTTESIVVFVDEFHHPLEAHYPDKVKDLAVAALVMLQNTDAKLGIIASTSAALALSDIQESVAMPVVGTVAPAVTAAVRATETGRIAVLAGMGDGRCSYEFVRRLNAMEPTIGVLQLANRNLDLLLQQKFDRADARAQIRALLDPADRIGVDVLLFSSPEHCQLSGLIHEVFPSRFTVVDIPAAVCSRVIEVLQQNRMTGSPRGARGLQILATAPLGDGFATAPPWAAMSIPEIRLVTLPDRTNAVPPARGHLVHSRSDLAHSNDGADLPMLPRVTEVIHVHDP